jgi:SAM-dependent methyltransferase
MGYLNPRPDENSIARFYSPEYEWYQAPLQKPWCRRQTLKQWLLRLVRSHYLGDPPLSIKPSNKIVARLAGLWLRPRRDSLLALPFHGDGRLLDFGCGSGWFAHRMQQRGWTVTGIDISCHVAQKVRREFGIPVLVGSLPHPAVQPKSFDVVCMGSTLEHVHRPRQVVAAAGDALRPGGLLVVVVPNLDSWGFRRFGRAWWPLDVPRHLHHFTPNTLRRLVEGVGLAVRQVRMLGRAKWMRRSFAAGSRADAHRPPLWLKAAARSRLVASAITRWTVWTGQADCFLLIAQRPGASQNALHAAA